jgi:hypothetical protein
MSNGFSRTAARADARAPGADAAAWARTNERPVVPTKPDVRPASQPEFYQLLGIGWLALAAASIWIAILF